MVKNKKCDIRQSTDNYPLQKCIEIPEISTYLKKKNYRDMNNIDKIT